MVAMLHMPATSVEDMIRSGVPRNVAEAYGPRSSTTKIFAELATISISSARSVHPVRRLGESHVHDYTRGARTVAGTLVFAMLDRDVFAEVYRDNPKEVQAAAPFFVDQIPEFNIYVAASNEYGGTASAGLLGITLTNWGQTLSVDDIYTEVTYTFVAKFWLPFVESYGAFNALVQAQSEQEASMRSASRLIDGNRPAPGVDVEEEKQLDWATQYMDDISYGKLF